MTDEEIVAAALRSAAYIGGLCAFGAGLYALSGGASAAIAIGAVLIITAVMG